MGWANLGSLGRGKIINEKRETLNKKSVKLKKADATRLTYGGKKIEKQIQK